MDPVAAETGLLSQGRRPAAFCLALLLAIACMRLLTIFDPFPCWSVDPLQRSIPLLGIGPVMSLIMDALTVLASGVAVIAAARCGLRPALWLWILWAAGAIAVGAHAGLGSHATLQHWIAGMPWVAALAAALAMHTLCGYAPYRRLVVSVFAGLAIILLCKALVQVYIEHPSLVEAFQRDKEQTFLANGWSSDSSSARAYERRLMQAEASGWIGLANPFATFGAVAATLGFGGVLLSRKPLRQVLPATAMLATGLLITFLAGAKGGFAACACGFILVLLARFAPARLRSQKFGAALGLSFVFGVLGLVALRGIIGERLGELSIYFRSMYAQAAFRIFAEHPLMGVGPAGFKDAYLTAKNPLNPEEVTSPHSVMLDYLATLGAGGIAWVLILCTSMINAGRNILAPVGPDAQPAVAPTRADVRLAIAVLTVPTLIAAVLESAVPSHEEFAVRLGGLILGSIVCGLVMFQSIGVAALTGLTAAAALAALAHGQIDLTPVLASTALPWAILVGAGAARPNPNAASDTRISLSARVIAVLALSVAAFMAAGLPRLSQWERGLTASAADLRPLAEIQNLLALPGSDPKVIAEAAAIASEAIGQRVAADPNSIRRACSLIAEQRLPLATANLVHAAEASNTDSETLQALSRFYLLTPDRADTRSQLALNTAQQATAAKLGAAGSWGWYATVLRGIYDRNKQPAFLTQAIDAYRHAAELDPHSLPAVVHLVEVSQLAGDQAQAKKWAQAALDRHARTRLDPLKGLTSEELTRMKAIAGQ